MDERVAVLLPVRDEAARVTPCLRALLAQPACPDLEIVVLDDGSTDGTADVVRAVAAGDHGAAAHRRRRCRPAGWASRTPASNSPARRRRTTGVLVFVDADVVLAPDAVAAAVALLRGAGVDAAVAVPADRGRRPASGWCSRCCSGPG